MNTNNKLTAKAPKGFMRWLLRLPITLYRWHLGWLLGERFVLLYHIGRKSGLERQVVVEVIGKEGDGDIYYIASGWGKTSQWYKNLQAQPNIDIQIGRRRWGVQAIVLPPEEGAQILMSYRERAPRAARELGAVMGLNMVSSTPDELVAMVRDSLPILALERK
jgi:deazaflavin-dependent oxidoreductase (nitroreductase family)